VIAVIGKSKPVYRGLTRMSADRREKPFTTEDAKEHGGRTKTLPLMNTDDTDWEDCYPILLCPPLCSFVPFVVKWFLL